MTQKNPRKVVGERRLHSRDDPEQSRAFIKKAREIEADEEKSAADELLKRLASKKPEPRAKDHGE
jgi:hypothetical protein